MSCIAGFFVGAGSNAVGTLMVDYLVKPVERRIRYMFRFHKIVEELQDQKKALTTAQTQLQEDVNEAERHTETHEIEKYVLDWLTEAENSLEDVQSLESRIEENKKCFRWCPNWRWRYRLSKEMERKTEDVKKLVVETSKFGRIGHRADLTGLAFINAKGLVDTESSGKAFNEIMEALRNDAMNVIGVWGMGGSGKTTIVTQVGNKAQELQLFSKHIIVAVSQKPDIEKIQQTIADFLDLNFEKKSKEGKAAELGLQLKDEKKQKEKEEKVLIILDDMWDELELEKIAIPDRENSKRCKIILTTRERSVCELMKCQVTVSLGGFSEDEAWTLFRMKANLDNTDINVDPDIIEVAKEVAKECGGLPIAIVPLARALRSKDLNGWELARDKLKRSRLMDIDRIPKEVDKNAYLCLEMSYKHLGRKPTKICLLLCALFPEDSSIDLESLVRYAWTLRLYPEEDSIHNVRREVKEAIKTLVDSCLLLEEDYHLAFSMFELNIKPRHIKVHDVVRDVAMWIASKEDNGLVIKLGVGQEMEISKQQLGILLDHYRNETSVGYFAGMGELKVLSIKAASGESSFSLNALKSLTNLRAVELEGFENLDGMADLASLRELEILSLKDSECEEPIDILGDLKKLRVFDLRGSNFNSISISNLIRRFDQLEELYLRSENNAAILPVINLLPRLDSLSLDKVRSLDFPEGFMFPPRLQRYEIGINMGRNKEIISSRSLSISNTFPLNVIEELLPSVEFLYLKDIKEEGLRCLIDAVQMKKAEMLSKLKFLRLEYFPFLEYIWKIPTQRVSLGSLEVVSIRGCGKLKSIFSLYMVQSLVRLQALEISNCDELAQIVQVLEVEISAEVNPEKSLCFPELRYLAIVECSSLEYMFPNCMASQGFPKLQKLSMRSLSNLKQICRPANQNKENSNLLFPSLTEVIVLDCSEFTDTVHFSKPVKAYLEGFQLSELKEAFFMNIKDLTLENIEEHNLILEADPKGLNGTFSNLEHLKLNGCKKLKSLFSLSIVQSLQKLEELQIHRCDELKTVFAELENDGGTKSNNPLCLPKLTSLKISGCQRLEYVLPITLAQAGGLPQLEKLKIYQCSELKTLFADHLENDDSGTKSRSHLHPLCLQKLTSLDIGYCKRIEYVLPITLAQDGLPQLESVEVRKCTGLKHVFGGGKEDDGVEHCIDLPRLKDLNLRCVPNLSGFGPEKFFAKAPSLKSLFASTGRDNESSDSSDTGVFLEAVPLSGFKEFISHAKYLTLRDIMGHKNLVPDADLDLQGLTYLDLLRCQDIVSLYPVGVAQNLKNLTVESCCALEEVFEMDEHLYNQAPLLSKLVSLELYGLPKLRWILKGPTQYVSLQSLHVVKIQDCYILESLFSSSLIPSLKLLKELSIRSCKKLETVFSESESADETESNTLCFPTLQTLMIIQCLSLKHVFPLALRISLPNLKVVIIDSCDGLESVFSSSLIQSLGLLKELHIHRCRKLETVFTESESADKTESNTICLPTLETLEIRECPSLKHVFPLALSISLPNVKVVDISWCEKLERVFTELESDEGQTVLPSLKILQVFNCPLLSNFNLQEDKQLQSNDFEEVVVSCSSQLRERSQNLVIFEQLFQSPNLETLKLGGLEWLEYVWKGPIQDVLTHLTELEVYDCNNLTYIFPVIVIQNLPNLSSLTICQFENLQQIIGNDDMSASSQGLDQDERGVIKNEKEILMIPQLKKLKLERLASLVTFIPVGYHLVFPCLDFLEIKDCPRMITSFTQDSDSKVHAKTEARRLDDPSLSKLKIRWRRDGKIFLPFEANDKLPLYVEEADEISAMK